MATDAQVRQFLLRQIDSYSKRSAEDFHSINKLAQTVIKLKEVPNMFGDVSKFIEACDQEKSEQGAILYNRLINEEHQEYTDAYMQFDDVATLDACMDMIWVILGFCYMKGYDVSGAWHEVARSNLSKINSETGKVIKREDGKVLKPEGWTPPSLEQFTK